MTFATNHILVSVHSPYENKICGNLAKLGYVKIMGVVFALNATNIYAGNEHSK